MLAIHDALDAAGLPHAIGGGVALGFYTVGVRTAHDLDLNVFVGPERAAEVMAALPPDIAVNDVASGRTEWDAELRLRWHGTSVHIFFNVLPFHEQVQTEVRLVTLEGRDIPIVSPIALAVFKAMFDQPRHWADIEEMVGARALDTDRALAAINGMTGEGSTIASRLAAMHP